MRFRQWACHELRLAMWFFALPTLVFLLVPWDQRVGSYIGIMMVFVIWRTSENMLAKYRARNREVENEQRFRRNTY